VPHYEDSLCFEVVLGFHDVLGEVLAVVRDLSPHIVYHEGLGEVVLIVGVGHRLEVKSHHSSAFDIAKLELASRSVHVNIKELGDGGSVLWEVGVTEAFLPFLVVINHVVGLRRKQLVELFVFENLIESPDFVNRGFSTLVSNTGCNRKS